MRDQIDYSIYYKRWHGSERVDFDAAAQEYERWLLPQLANIPRTANVLDFGCGYGMLAYFLMRHFSTVTGVDSSPEQVAIGLKHALPVRVVSNDEFSEWTDSNAQAFDVIFLMDVLEHIPVADQMAFTRGLVNMLKPGGSIFIKVPNANSLLASRWRYGDWTHCSSFTESSLDFVCLNSGLQDLTYLNDESSVHPRLRWLPRWGLRQYYLRSFLRGIWRIYLYAELGSQIKQITVGYNLFLRARKP